MIKIPLTKGYAAIIDDADCDLVLPIKWYALVKGYGVYACNKTRSQGMVYMHRLILAASNGQIVDHINSNDTLDNRRANLRFATKSQNDANKVMRRKRSLYNRISWGLPDKLGGFLLEHKLTLKTNCIILGNFPMLLTPRWLTTRPPFSFHWRICCA